MKIIKRKTNLRSLIVDDYCSMIKLIEDKKIASIVERNEQLSKLILKTTFHDKSYISQIFANVNNLKYLNFYCQLYQISDDKLPFIIANNKSLEYLFLSDCFELTNNGYSYLADNLHHLKHLKICQ